MTICLCHGGMCEPGIRCSWPCMILRSIPSNMHRAVSGPLISVLPPPNQNCFMQWRRFVWVCVGCTLLFCTARLYFHHERQRPMTLASSPSITGWLGTGLGIGFGFWELHQSHRIRRMMADLDHHVYPDCKPHCMDYCERSRTFCDVRSKLTYEVSGRCFYAVHGCQDCLDPLLDGHVGPLPHGLREVNCSRLPAVALRQRILSRGCRGGVCGARDVCDAVCPDPFDGGYKNTVFKGGVEQLLCPSMFQHLADYVFRDPLWESFGQAVHVANRALAPGCLPPVPIIYTKTDEADTNELAAFARRLPGPYILITGQSDKSAAVMQGLLRDERLVHWFAQNADLADPRVTPIPIGLNCFAQGAELQTVLREHAARGRPPKTGVLLLSHSNATWPDGRERAWRHFCAPERREWVSCVPREGGWSYVDRNPRLVDFYRSVLARHKFVLAPSGGGLDTHRVWEALYMRTIPVVYGRGPREQIQELYAPAELPIVVVEDLEQVTRPFLERQYERLLPRFEGGVGRLGAGYWRQRINAVREGELRRRKIVETAERRRCWHSVFGPAKGV